MRLNYHPAPGLGDLLPGFFVVPQNPVRDAETALVPSVQALNPGAILKKPHIGDFLPGTFFAVPQNPVRKNLATGMGGLSCGGSGQCSGGNFYGMSGMGATTATTTPAPTIPFSTAITSMANFQAWLQQPSPVSASVPNWALYGGGALAVFALMISQKGRR